MTNRLRTGSAERSGDGWRSEDAKRIGFAARESEPSSESKTFGN